MKKENIEEQSKFEIIEKYVYSNLDDNYSLGLSPEEINNIKMERLSLNNEIESFFKTNEFANVSFLAHKYTSLKSSSTTGILLLSKVATFLFSPMIKSSIEDFIKIFSLKYLKKDYNKSQKQYIKDNCSNIFKTFFSLIDIHITLNTLFPDIFEEDEIDEYEIKITECLEKDEDIIPIIDNINEKFRNRVRNEYDNMRAYKNEVQNRILANDIENKNELSNYNISEKTIEWCKILICSSYIVNHYREDYDSWIGLDDMYKSLLYLSDPKYQIFHKYYYHVDGMYMFYFFRTLNEPHAFGKAQIDYILEMAPKLRISSYLNKEYAKYKKLYNPDARDFDFGKDEPEKETFETITSKDHLEPLPHFEDEKLKKLLNILIDAEYIDENTRDRDWLFALGMSGDKKPKDFKKIQWIGGSKTKGISPSYFIDFIGILGYDLNKIYEDKVQIIILNQCFKTTKVDIQQKNIKKNKKFIVTPKHEEMTKLVKKAQLLPG